MSEEKNLFNLKDNDVEFLDNKYLSCIESDEIEDLSFIETIDKFINSNFHVILAIGIPVLILDVMLFLFWMLIYYS